MASFEPVDTVNTAAFVFTSLHASLYLEQAELRRIKARLAKRQTADGRRQTADTTAVHTLTDHYTNSKITD